jgi:hypothetical protein
VRRTFRSTAVEKACPTPLRGVLSQHGEQNAPAPRQLLNVTLEGSANERLVAAVAGPDPGESAVASFGRVLIAGFDQSVSRADMIAKVATLIKASPALQAREREVTAPREREVTARYTGDR